MCKKGYRGFEEALAEFHDDIYDGLMLLLALRPDNATEGEILDMAAVQFSQALRTVYQDLFARDGAVFA